MSERLLAEPAISSADIVRALLLECSISGPPTDAEHIARCLHLSVRAFDDLDPRIRAYLDPGQRQIGVHKALTPTRRTFSILHEIGHLLLPGHAIGRIEDSDSHLTMGEKKSQTLREIEANQFAADCLFQLEHFDEYIHAKALEWASILRAASVYNASIEATARRWVERTSHEAAVVVFKPTSNRVPLSPLSLLYTVASPAFKEEYFARLRLEEEVGSDSPFHAYFYGTVDEAEPRLSLQVEITPDRIECFDASLFSNNYRLFALLRPVSPDEQP